MKITVDSAKKIDRARVIGGIEGYVSGKVIDRDYDVARKVYDLLGQIHNPITLEIIKINYVVDASSSGHAVYTEYLLDVNLDDLEGSGLCKHELKIKARWIDPETAEIYCEKEEVGKVEMTANIGNHAFYAIHIQLPDEQPESLAKALILAIRIGLHQYKSEFQLPVDILNDMEEILYPLVAESGLEVERDGYGVNGIMDMTIA